MGSQAETGGPRRGGIGLRGLKEDFHSLGGDQAPSNGVRIEEIRGIAGAREIEELQMQIWGSNESWIVPSHVLHIVSDYGGILLGAHVDGKLVGFVVGFLARSEGKLFHASHMLGVLPEHQHRGIGAALKRRQRQQAQEQGLDVMTWTFDPLEARNAYFNLHKLGATSRSYREDFYGPMQDELNRDLPSDRLLVEWNLRSADRSGGHGEERYPAATPVTILYDRENTPELHLELASADQSIAIHVPADIQILKRDAPDAALAWRIAVRRAFTFAMGMGYEVRDFANGSYILFPRGVGEE
jgi:predicted GNAT superfamily acetyltransferase